MTPVLAIFVVQWTISQGQVVWSRHFTIVGRPKATGEIGNGTSSSTKLSVVKDEHSDCITSSRSHLVSQSLEQPSQQASATVKSHAGAEKKNGCPDSIEKLVPGNHKQLSECTASHRSTVVQSMSSRPVPSNLYIWCQISSYSWVQWSFRFEAQVGITKSIEAGKSRCTCF